MGFDTFDPRLVVYVCIAAGILLLVEAVRQMLSPEDDAALQKAKRIRALTAEQSAEVLSQKMRRRRTVGWVSRVPYFGNLPVRMRQAGMSLNPRLLLMISGVLTIVTFVFISVVSGPLIALAIALAVGVLLPMSAINIARNRRMDAFSRQLPEALDLMKRGLSVGHPVSVTIQNVSRNMKDPIAYEFGKMADQVAYGDALPDAVRDMANRIDLEDAYYLAASIEIQYGSGGNLGNMLGTLSKVIRSRFAMRRRIRAFSSEGRISAIILTMMPFIMYGGTKLTAPTYYSSVAESPMFLPMIGGIIFFVVGNGIMLHKLVNFKF